MLFLRRQLIELSLILRQPALLLWRQIPQSLLHIRRRNRRRLLSRLIRRPVVSLAGIPVAAIILSAIPRIAAYIPVSRTILV
jgi:hypothetical protein